MCGYRSQASCTTIGDIMLFNPDMLFHGKYIENSPQATLGKRQESYTVSEYEVPIEAR
jgi:hypothetical protein